MDNQNFKPLSAEEFITFVDAWQDSENKDIGAEMAGRILLTTAMLGTRAQNIEELLICAVMAGAHRLGEWGAMLSIPKTVLTNMPEGTQLAISEISIPPTIEVRVHLPKKPIVIAQDFRRNGI
jgi:hypothetical protein